MALAARLLMASGGGGSFAIPAPPPTTYTFAVGSPVTVVNDAKYNAFPGLARTSGGTLLAAYRSGTDHATTTDGVILLRTSTDNGATWSAESTIFDDPSLDCRDAEIAVLSDGTVICSFFKWNGATAASAFVTTSTDGGATWGTPVDIGGSFSYEQVSAKVVELGDGSLIIPAFGNAGSGNRTCYIMRSSDGGATWDTQTTIASGTHDWAEPYVVRLSSGRLHCLIRVVDISDIYRCYSDDDGATWSTPAFAFDGGSRSAHTVLGASMLVVYRPPSFGDTLMRQSDDGGATWSAATTIDTDGVNCTYASLVPYGSDVFCLYGVEQTASNGDLKFLTFTGTPA